MRDYDKEPIKIIDRAVYFQEKSLFLSIVLFYSVYTTNATFMDINKRRRFVYGIVRRSAIHRTDMVVRKMQFPSLLFYVL